MCNSSENILIKRFSGLMDRPVRSSMSLIIDSSRLGIGKIISIPLKIARAVANPAIEDII